MTQDNLFASNGKASNDRFLLSIEYCGNCHGTCDGCPLTKEQLMNSKGFFDLRDKFEDIMKILNQVSHKKNVAIEFGRGNHLTLSEKPWDDLIWFIKEVERSCVFNHLNIEISTSLIGNVNYQIEKAKTLVNLVKENEDIDVKFVVVANTNVTSNAYWNKITSFLKIMEEHRATDDYGCTIDQHQDFCGDVLLLNLFPKQIPDIHFLYRQIYGIKSPINLAWWLNDERNSSITREDMLCFEGFLKEFVSYIDFNKIDTSLHEVLRLCSESGYDLLNNKDILNQIVNNASFHIDMHGNTKRLFFSPVGVIDHEKKICRSDDMEKFDTKKYANDMLLAMSKRKSCVSCPHFKKCFYSGMLNVAYFNDRTLNMEDDICPTGTKSAFDALFSQEA